MCQQSRRRCTALQTKIGVSKKWQKKHTPKIIPKTNKNPPNKINNQQRTPLT
jgi:hypothetical protein